MIFRSITVQPAYGRNKVVVSWALDPDYEAGDIYVYRSPTGIDKSEDWELLNPDAPVNGVDFYTDLTLSDKNLFRHYHYRLLLDLNGTYYDSPVMGMFSEDFNKTEYGALYTMRRREYLRMRSGNGVRVIHAIPSSNGDKADNYDHEAEKQITACHDDESYGEEFQKGYKNVVQTWAEMLNAGPETNEQTEGGGYDQKQQFNFRLLAFPKPESGHIIIFPNSDKRFLVENGVQPFLFKGHLPVAYQVPCSLLDRADPRHKIEIPDLLSDPDYPVVYNRAL